MSLNDLTLPEALALLALNDATGERHAEHVNYSLAGASLAELALAGAVIAAPDKARHMIAGAATPADPYLTAVLERLDLGDTPRKADGLVAKIAEKGDLFKILFDGLIARGILNRREKKVLFFFTKTVYPQADPSAEQALKSDLEAVMFYGQEPTTRQCALIALCRHIGLLKANFDRERLRMHKSRIDQIAAGAPLAASATKDAIEAMNAAIMVAVMVPAIVN